MLSTTSLALVAICTVLLLLGKKESLLGSQDEADRRLSRALNIAIVPLMIVFCATVLVQVFSVLS